MLELIKRYREHLAAVVAVIVALNLVTGVVNQVLQARSSTLVASMRSAGGLSLGLVSVLFLLLTAGACVLLEPTTKHARLIAVVDAVLVSLGTVIALVNVIGVMLGPEATIATIFEGIGGGTDVALKGVAAAVLWVLARRVPLAQPQPADAPPAPAVPEQAQAQPTWSRDAAAGVSWQSARQAAQGTGSQWRSGAQPPPGLPGPQPQPAPASQPAPPPPPVPGASEGPAAKADRSLWEPPQH